MEDKKDIELLLYGIESACELYEDGNISFEGVGRLFYEYLSEPIVHALTYKLSVKSSYET